MPATKPTGFVPSLLLTYPIHHLIYTYVHSRFKQTISSQGGREIWDEEADHERA